MLVFLELESKVRNTSPNKVLNHLGSEVTKDDLPDHFPPPRWFKRLILEIVTSYKCHRDLVLNALHSNKSFTEPCNFAPRNLSARLLFLRNAWGYRAARFTWYFLLNNLNFKIRWLTLRIWLWSDFVEIIIFEILAVDLLIHLWCKLDMAPMLVLIWLFIWSNKFLLVTVITEHSEFEFGY